LLAAQECYFRAMDEGSEPGLIAQLKDHYFDIKAGIGMYKSPGLYGAFPTDAYSHTPGNSGAKQPGMTGQVKEDVISRMRELGVKIVAGKVQFDASLLNHTDFEDRDGDRQFTYLAIDGRTEHINLFANQLAFTLCQVPVVYSVSDRNEIEVVLNGDEGVRIKGNSLDLEFSNMIFSRSGEIRQLKVSVTLES